MVSTKKRLLAMLMVGILGFNCLNPVLGIANSQTDSSGTESEVTTEVEQENQSGDDILDEEDEDTSEDYNDGLSLCEEDEDNSSTLECLEYSDLITIMSDNHTSINVITEDINVGSEVSYTVDVADGYKLSSTGVYGGYEDNGCVDITEITNTDTPTYTFIMPDTGVVIFAESTTDSSVETGESGTIFIDADDIYITVNEDEEESDNSKVEDDIVLDTSLSLSTSSDFSVVGSFSTSALNTIITSNGYEISYTTYNSGGSYLSDAISGLTRSSLLSWLGSHYNDTYYLGTAYPNYSSDNHGGTDSYYQSGHDRRNANGDISPFGDGTYGVSDLSGIARMNCTGFVWNVLVHASDYNTSTLEDYTSAFEDIPCMTENSRILSTSSSSWATWLSSENIEYRTYSYSGTYSTTTYAALLQAVLNDGYLEVGDMIWLWDGNYSMEDGLPAAVANNHHIGIYTGGYFSGTYDSSSMVNEWWSSIGYSYYNSVSYMENCITEIIPKASSTYYITVVKIDSTGLEGYIQLSKSSSNSNYSASVSGAIYGVYTTSSCTGTAVETLTISSNGTATSNGLSAGTYYIKEISAPTGYQLSSTITSVTVTAGDTTTVSVTDTPVTATFTLTKSSANSTLTSGNSNYSVANATYTIYTNSGCTSVASDANGNNATMTTNTSGVAKSPELFVGTYYVKETSSSDGYGLDTTVYTVVIANDGSVTIAGKSTTSFTSSEPVQTVSISVAKSSANTEITSGNSCYTLKGAVYGVWASSDGKTSSSAKSAANSLNQSSSYFVGTITTNASGKGTMTGLAYGYYYVREITAPDGYVLDETTYTLNCTLGSSSLSSSNVYTLSVSDEPASDPLSITITKQSDQDVETPISMAGAVFVVKYYTTTDAKSVSDLSEDDLERTWYITTKLDDDGSYAAYLDTDWVVSGSDDLYTDDGEVVCPIGTYTIQEYSAPEGYTTEGGWMYLTDNDTTEAVSADDGIIFIQVLSDDSTSGASVTVTNALSNDFIITEKSIWGGVAIQKYDAETATTTAQGAATLAGAEIAIISLNEYDVEVEGESFSYGEIVLTIATDENGYATTAEDTLPYGTYKVIEVKAPTGYLLNEDWSQTFSITEENVIVTVDNDGEELAVYDQIIRSDFDIIKITSDTQVSMAGVVFKITLNETGESHYFTTDANGYYSSESSWISHLTDTNGGTSASGMWFGDSDPDDSLGALVYGTYTVEEIACEANEGYNLYTGTIVVYRDGITISLGTIEDSTVNVVTSAKFEETNSRYYGVSENTVIIDTITYEGLTKGNTYTFVGYLYNKTTGSFVTDADGNEVTAVTTFTAKSGISSSVEQEFVFDSTGLEGCDLVVFEYLYAGETESSSVLYAHADLDDDDQTVHFAKIGTSAVDSETGIQFSFAEGTLTIIDTVEYTNLRASRAYVLTGTLYSKTTGEAIKDADGNTITSTKLFTTSDTSGTVEVEFTVDADIVKGDAVVVFETLTYALLTYATHEDLDDDGQTVYIPEISTAALDSASATRNALAAENCTIVDTITYSGLKAGERYVIKGYLVDENGDKVIDCDGLVASVITSFTATAMSGTVDVEFNFNATGMENTDVVAYETIYYGSTLIAAHTDLDDIDQTIEFIEIGTTAIESETNDHLALADESVTITDTVEYHNAIVGYKYTMTGTLYVKSTGEVLTDANGDAITASKTFTATATDGSVELTFTFDASLLANETVVAFENMSVNGVDVAIHADLTDEDQSIHIPDIKTSAKDSETEDQLSFADDEITAIDTVAYYNLLVGKTYTVNGILMDQSTGEKLLDDNGNEITATATFTAETTDGTVDVTFVFSGATLAGKTAVVYEDLYYNGVLIAIHEDIDDESQMIHIPEISTTAHDAASETQNMLAADGQTVVDVVAYKNLIAGKEYVMTGTLYVKSTGEVLTDTDGNPVTSSVTFTPDSADGEVEVSFTVDASTLENVTLVAYETLTFKSVVIAEHNDIDDFDQSIFIPKIRTTAIDSETNDHLSYADDEVTVIDTVAYDNLVIGYTYTIEGVLYDQSTGKALTDVNGKNVTSSITFTATSTSGSIDLTFKFDASELAGKSVVAYEELYVNNTVVAIHADIEDEAQTIHLPEISTTALDAASETHNMLAADEQTIVDTVAYSNLIAGKEYVMTGALYVKSTGEALTDAEGNVVTGSVTFTPDSADGEVEISFTVDASAMENVTLVAYEVLTFKGVVIATHCDIDDFDQSIYIPKIRTTALESETNDHLGLADESVTITDTVTYQNLVVGYKYTVVGTLYNKSTGEALLGADGKPITQTVEFTATTTSGSIDLVFEIDASELAGESVVAYESLYVNNTLVAIHADLTDEDQTIHLPKIGTTAIDSDTNDHLAYADEEVTITDTVVYENLIVGYEYVVKGVLMDQTTGEPALDDEGNEITAELTFIAKTADGSVELTFVFSATTMANTTVVAHEYVYYNGVLIAIHADIEDEEQAVHIPEIATTAADSETEDHLAYADDEVTVIDTVNYKNLIVGYEYTVKGILMDQSTGEPALDDEGNEITAEVTFVAELADCSVDLTFVFPASTMANSTVVAYEKLYYNDVLIANHEDIEDEEQAVHIPEIATTALDAASDTHNMLAADEQTVIDTVVYRNLIPGKEYVMTGVLMVQETGEALCDADGYVIMASTVFAPESADGEVTLEFTVDASSLENVTLVAYETLTFNAVVIATHCDIDDFEQSIFIPKIRTTAVDAETETHTSHADDDVVVVDTVAFDNLIVGYSYTVVGTIYLKSTGEALVDSEGNAITSTKTFVAEATSGTVDLEFAIDASEFAGDAVVVFEEIYTNDVLIGIHADIDDEGQSVYFPTVSTLAADSNTGDHVALASETATIIDYVSLSNIVVGETYTVVGYLHDSETGEALVDTDGSVISSSIEFTALATEQTVEVVFEIDATELAGKTVIAFEHLYSNGIEVADHSDIEDYDQSISYPAIATTATNSESENHYSIADESVIINDEVAYSNLVVGYEYTVVGTLYVKSTGEPLMDADGYVVTARATFTAEETDGTIVITFEFDGSTLAGDAVVAFETIYHNNVEVAIHADLEDEEQTVYFPGIKTMAVDGLTGTHTGTAEEETSIIDTVTYTNLEVGETYTVVGVLCNADTGETLLDAEGNEITASTVFIPETTDGSIDVTFEFDGTEFADMTVVVFEYLYKGEDTETSEAKLVAYHTDLTDTDQQVLLEAPPEIRTGDVAFHMLIAALAGAVTAAAVMMYLKRRKEEF